MQIWHYTRADCIVHDKFQGSWEPSVTTSTGHFTHRTSAAVAVAHQSKLNTPPPPTSLI
ncbi:hypothetical protein BaRGS_00029537, partial [Batillaria attramentaria]